jgi:hypothetical protein
VKLYLQILLLTACFLQPTFSQPLCASRSHKTYEIARGFIGTKEVGNNGGYWVQRFQKVSNAPKGSPWCAAFVNFCLDSAGVKGLPNTRNGLARSFATKNKTIKASTFNGELPAGTIIVWRRGNTLFGHAGVVEKWNGKKGTTVEGNTSSGAKGSQSEGDGVWRRRRAIDPSNFFRITDFILF